MSIGFNTTVTNRSCKFTKAPTGRNTLRMGIRSTHANIHAYIISKRISSS